MRKIFISIIFIFCLLFSTKVAFAQATESFATSANVSYTIQSDGKALVEYAVSLVNLDSQIYATSYSLVIAGITPASPYAIIGEQKIPLEITKRESESTALTVNFPDSVVGVGQKREFKIVYIDSTVATKQGEIWEVEIPRISSTNNFGNLSLQLVVPQNLGVVAFISPNPLSKNTENNTTRFTFNEQMLAKGVSAAFGKFQVFSYDLTYHLENPLVKRAYVEIALPPDTSYQKIYLNQLTPAADEMYVDSDGNWIAKYILDSRQRVDVRALGAAQLFSFPYKKVEVKEEDLASNLQPSNYWQTKDPEIEKLAKELKNPQAIYDYVVNTLTYDYERVKPNITRLGALQVLHSPQNAICMEFTDLFVAISRAAGIPAREVNGYAYAENPELQPLSLVADVLHSWAEYWDAEKGIWVPVDPTWGNTTGGIDFFHKLDLRHFAFVMHGKDAVNPYPAGSYKLGANPQKDVFVSFSTLPESRDPEPEVSVLSQDSSLFRDMKVKVGLTNSGSTALYDNSVEIYFDGALTETKPLETLLPHSKQSIDINVPVTFLGYKMPQMVTVKFGNQALDIPTHKEVILLSNLSLLFLLFFLILLAAQMKLRKNVFKLDWKLWKRIKLKR